MKKIEELRKKAMALPDSPGVYIMKNLHSEIIYIGKAKNLKNRVSQYFVSLSAHTSKVMRMVENVDQFDYIIVGSEFEALVLECNLIKQYKPKYNILLKDDKGYSYIKISDTDGWKTISCVFNNDDQSAKYYGPYMSSDYVSSAIKEAKDVFMLPHCNKRFPKDINRNVRPCLNYHLKLCAGACSGKVKACDNNKNVNDALEMILSGKSDTVNRLKEEMNEASENLEFEKAAKIRDKIRAIEKVSLKQNVVSLKHPSQDIFGVDSIGEKTCVNVLNIRNATIINTDNFIIDRIEDNDDDFAGVITAYYSSRDTDYPDRICINHNFVDTMTIDRYLKVISDKSISVINPKSGESHNLLQMAVRNASEKLSRVLSFNDKKKSALFELKELLNLDTFPSVIEAYDISNMNGSENVGGMVVFIDGKPSKKNYRKFMIKSFDGQDDFRSLAEVLNRRIAEYHINEGEAEGFGLKPDLILIDGGEGQVNAVRQVFAERGFAVPLFGMVKDGKHRTRAITTGGREITINDNRSVFTLISEIQEEVHRYAIGYHRTLKKKNTFASELTLIPGVGEKRAKNLMIKFRNLDNIKNATVDELALVPGINDNLAQIIYDYFH